MNRALRRNGARGGEIEARDFPASGSDSRFATFASERAPGGMEGDSEVKERTGM